MRQTISALVHLLIRIGNPLEHKRNYIRLLCSKRLYPSYQGKMRIVLDIILIPIDKKLVFLLLREKINISDSTIQFRAGPLH
ncbi:hypothetical protein D3C78_598250 [compost metagenome]